MLIYAMSQAILEPSSEEVLKRDDPVPLEREQLLLFGKSAHALLGAAPRDAEAMADRLYAPTAGLPIPGDESASVCMPLDDGIHAPLTAWIPCSSTSSGSGLARHSRTRSSRPIPEGFRRRDYPLSFPYRRFRRNRPAFIAPYLVAAGVSAGTVSSGVSRRQIAGDPPSSGSEGR
jgi:hypothetical protein